MKIEVKMETNPTYRASLELSGLELKELENYLSEGSASSPTCVKELIAALRRTIGEAKL